MRMCKSSFPAGVGGESMRNSRHDGSPTEAFGDDRRRAQVLCALLSALCFLSACVSPRMTVKQGYDFSKIKKVSVAAFAGPGGDAVSDEFVRHLVGSGLEITDAKHAGDVVLNGSVTEYRPSDKLMVFLGDTSLMGPNGQTVVLNNPIVSLSGTQVTSQGPAMGVPNTQVVSVSATVGVIARLVDTATGNVVWADSMSYEGLDIQSALQGTIGSLVRSLGRVIPQMAKK